MDQGLSNKEAAARLRKLGPPPETSSRSLASIVAGNVFTLFNAIIGAFFLLDVGLGLYADAIFGLIAVINSSIGIYQEKKAKETLDEIAVLVAPQARVIRDGAEVELTADEVVPGDVVQVGPGDQLVADGEAIASRGMTMDESLLTGESDGIRKGEGDRVLSGSFCVSGSGHYVVDAVREESYAGRIAGEAKTFRHPPSPLQEEVNRVILASTYVMLPLAAVLVVSLKVRNTPLEEAAQTATAGLVTLIPEGLVLLMSVTFAVAAVRLANRNTLIQQMSATESLASVDMICVDKTGTLTAGELRLRGGRVRRRGRSQVGGGGAGALRRQRRRPQHDPGDDRRGVPRQSRDGARRGALLLGVEVERRRPQRGRRRHHLRARGAGHPRRVRRADPAAGPRRQARDGDRRRAARRRLRADERAAAGRSGRERGAADAAAGAGRAGGDAATRRGGDDRLHARAGSRPEADLGRRRARP